MQPKMLFVHSGNETFVKLDREILSEFAVVNDLFAQRKFPAGFGQYWLGVREADIIFCWFASWNSFWTLLFAKLFKKPSILVIGGYDIANLPESDYGLQRGGIGKWVSHSAMKLATELITNSYYSQGEVEQNARITSKNVKVIYHGVPDLFGSMPSMLKERIALTVGKVDWPNLKRKGLEPFVRSAMYLPDIQFILVGDYADNSIEYLRSIASENVIFTGRASGEELINYYQRASVYVQASLHEGFGMSCAEAMLAGCIPVTTRAGSLPEVVGDCGFYCNSPEPSDVARTIVAALNTSQSVRQKARERILSYFPMEKRKKELGETILSISPNGLHTNDI